MLPQVFWSQLHHAAREICGKHCFLPFFILFLQYVGDIIQPGIPLAGRATCQDGLRSACVPSPMGSWRQLLVFAPCKATVGWKSRGTAWSWRNLTKKISFLGKGQGVCLPWAAAVWGVPGLPCPDWKVSFLPFSWTWSDPQKIYTTITLHWFFSMQIAARDAWGLWGAQKGRGCTSLSLCKSTACIRKPGRVFALHPRESPAVTRNVQGPGPVPACTTRNLPQRSGGQQKFGISFFCAFLRWRTAWLGWG